MQYGQNLDTRPLPRLVPPLPGPVLWLGGLRQHTSSPGIWWWQQDSGRRGAIAGLRAAPCPLRCPQPSPGIRGGLAGTMPAQPSPAAQPPAQAVAAGGAGWAGTCRDRLGAATAGAGSGERHPAPLGAGAEISTQGPGTVLDGCARCQCSDPSPTLGAMGAGCSTPCWMGAMNTGCSALHQMGAMSAGC